MEDSVIFAIYMRFVIVIVVLSWLIFALPAFFLIYKHDSYIDKNFPELSKSESVFLALHEKWRLI